jgi:hypothetical protein
VSRHEAETTKEAGNGGDAGSQEYRTMSNLVIASVGAGLGLLSIYFGLNFHIGQWFIGGNAAYIPAAIGGAAIALLIRYLLRHT